MKMEVLENENIVLDGAILRKSLICMIEDMQNGNNCDINRWIAETEINTASDIEDKDTIDLIGYFRFIRKIFEEFKSA